MTMSVSCGRPKRRLIIAAQCRCLAGSDPTHSRSWTSSSCCNLEVWLKMAERKMFGSTETDKTSDFIVLSDDALEQASGGGLPIFNAKIAPGDGIFVDKLHQSLNLNPWTWWRERDHGAWQPNPWRP